MQESFVEDDWNCFGRNGTQLSSCLEVGDSFAVAADDSNDEDVNFYVLMCTKVPFTVVKEFEDAWGNSFLPDDIVVATKYFQKWVGNPSNYVLLWNSQTTYHHAHHVITLKFPMFPLDHRVTTNDLVYKLTRHTLSGIQMALDLLAEDN